MANKKDEDILLTDSMRAAGKSAVPDPEAAERNARKEYQKRMKQYKNKRHRKIFGLILESILLLVLCVGLWGINTFVKALDIMTDQPGKTNPSGQAQPGLPSLDPSGTQGQPTFVIEDPEGSTEIIAYTLPSDEPVETVTAPVKTGFSTFAVFGVDARDNEHLDQWTQGDVVILVSLNNATHEIKLCSVYRDCAFESEVNGGLGKITDSYCQYGAIHTVEAMSRNFDLQIDDYVVVNWTAVADVVDALGGIDMYLTKEEATEMRGFVYETELVTKRPYKVRPLPQEAATYHLNGGQTIAVARRFSFDKREIIDLLADAKAYNIGGSAGFPFNHVTFPIPTSFVYAADLEQDVTQLHNFLYGDENYVPSSNIRRINAFAKQEMDSIRTKLNLP